MRALAADQRGVPWILRVDRRDPALGRKLLTTSGWLARHPSELRHVPEWLGSLRTVETPLATVRPWVTFVAAEWLAQRTSPRTHVFEWGCGGSTLYLVSRGARLVSVEHDPMWARQVERALESHDGSRHDLMLIEAQQPRNDGRYGSGAVRGASFESYARSIERFDDRAFDMVLVDGRARIACIEHAIPKVARGGWIVLDNSERLRYRAARKLLANYPRIDLPGLGPHVGTPWVTSAWEM